MARREINKKNYFKLGIILGAVIFITLLIANIYTNTLKRNVDGGYLANHFKTIQFNDLENAKVEFFEDTLLYISFTGDREVYEFDRNLRKSIRKYELEEVFIYLNMIDYMEEEGYIDEINKALGLDSIKISTLPVILYFQDGILIDLLDDDVSIGGFSKFLEMYELNITYD